MQTWSARFGQCRWNAATIRANLHWSRLADAVVFTRATSRTIWAFATVLVPEHAGVLSALGMLLADSVRDYTAGVLGRSEWSFRELEKAARKDMPGCKLERYFDMRYMGQSYELSVPEGSSFHDAHRRMYGYADEHRPTEVVAIRVRAVDRVEKLQLQSKQNKSRSRDRLLLRIMERLPGSPRAGDAAQTGLGIA